MTGTEVLIDGLERSGSLIIGPSFVERRLRVKTKSSVSAHNLEVYRAGLIAIIDDALFTKRMREREMMSDVSLSSTALTTAPLPPPLPSPQHIEEKGEKDEVGEEEGFDADLLPVTKTDSRDRKRNVSTRVNGGYEGGGAQYVGRYVSSVPATGASYGYSSLIDLSGDQDDLAEHNPTSHHTSHSSPSSPATYNPIISNTTGEDDILI